MVAAFTGTLRVLMHSTGTPLVTPEELAAAIANHAAPAVLDVRWELATGADQAAYLAGHVPGAVFVDLDQQLADPPSERGRHPLPDAGRFGAAMRAAGVSHDRPVVVYDAATAMAAARAWWLLRYFGHPDVAVLDGGLAGWVGAGRPLSSAVPVPEPGDFIPQPGAMPILTPEQAGTLGSSGGILLDARARERFLGVSEPIDPVAGHIPGARNRPTTANLAPGGRFLAPPMLRSAFELAGVREDAPVGVYCGSGVTAAHEVLALELAGYRAALYPGSWSEWIRDPARPLATGDERAGAVPEDEAGSQSH